MSILSQVPLTASGNILLVATSQGAGPAGWRVTFLGSSWTGSVVLANNRGAPGQAVSLTNIAYLTASTGATNTAGTAITSSGDYIIPLSSCVYDLYAVYTHTSGSCAVKVLTEDAGGSSGDGITAAEVDGSASQNTFGAAVPYTGAYTFPGALAITGALSGVTQIAFASGSTSHFIDFEGMTLAASKNAIRGASVNPTRTSGWTSFSGTVSTTPNPVYMDYRELHSTGAAEVLGMGLFPFMDSGATGKSMYALQAICEADAGATIGAATAVGEGVFPIWAKCLINGAGMNASGVAAAAFLSFQANVTDVSALDTSMVNMEVASGGINSIFKFQCSAAAGATYFVNFENNGYPAEKTTAKTTQVNDVVGNIAVLVGDQVGYINIHSAKAT
jgi:hypothetical protein